MEKYREEFGLSDDLSVKDIFEEVKNRSLVLKENLNKLKEARYEKDSKQETLLEVRAEVSPSSEVKKEDTEK